MTTRAAPVALLAQTARLARAGRDLARLAVPLECGGCGLSDVVLCPGCTARLSGPVRRVEQGAPRLDPLDGTVPWPVLAAAAYTGPVRETVVAWKDRGRVDLTGALRAALAPVADEAGALVLPSVSPGGQVWVVPVPSTPGARRRRGREPTTDLARAVAARLGRAGAHGATARPPVAPVGLVRALVHVRRRRGVRDQVGLGVRARAGNLAGTLEVRARLRGGPVPSGVRCVLVDDVLTTGATLAECARALARSGHLTVAAVVLAATPSPQDTGGP